MNLPRAYLEIWLAKQLIDKVRHNNPNAAIRLTSRLEELKRQYWREVRK